MSRCPTCGATFEVAQGFCPADGTALVVGEARRVGGAAVGTSAVAAGGWVPASTPEPQPGFLRPVAPSERPTDEPPAGAVSGPPRLDADGEEMLLGAVLGGRYLVQDRIGAGGMGVVYRGLHQGIDKPVAIKVLRHDYAEVGDAAKRFELEARVASKIRHPNVVEISDYGFTPGGAPYYVMELMTGRSLANVIDDPQTTLAPARAAEIAIEIARGLTAAHGQGVVHRDLKPDNVFLDVTSGSEHAKILDFGIARITGRRTRLTAAGSVVGTPEYMSPEQAQAQEVDARSDVYALGVILFEMLAGTVPLRGATMVETLTKQVYDPAPTLSSVAPQFAGHPVDLLLRSFLHKDRTQRPPDAATAAERIQAAFAVDASGLPTTGDDRGKATMAMGSWSVDDLRAAGIPVPDVDPSRRGPSFEPPTQAAHFGPAPTEAETAVVPPTTHGEGAAPAPDPTTNLGSESRPSAAGVYAVPPVQGGPVPGQPMPTALTPGGAIPGVYPGGGGGYAPGVGTPARRGPPVVLVVAAGLLGAVGVGLGVFALAQVFGAGAADEAIPSALEPSAGAEAQPAAEARPEGVAADQGEPAVPSVNDSLDPSAAGETSGEGAEGSRADGEADGAGEAPISGESEAAPSPVESRPSPPRPRPAKKKSTPKKAKPAVEDPEKPPPEPERPKDPPADPGVTLGDLRDPFG